MKAFATWLRTNAEHYLMIDAQGRIAARYGSRSPARPKGLMAWFFLTVFVPVYRALPWKLRAAVIRAMPGSHRQAWSPRDRHTRKPAI